MPEIRRRAQHTRAELRSPRLTQLLLVGVFLLPAGCQRQLMPTPNLYVDAPVDPFADVAAEFRSNEVELFYATDRAPETDGQGGLVYGFGRSDSLAYGTCVVELGDDLTWNELVAESRIRRRSRTLPVRVLEIEELGRFVDTPLDSIVIDGVPQDHPLEIAKQSAAEAELRDAIAARMAGRDRKEIFLFIHGFNRDFDTAAMIMAELWHFLGREGLPMIYTWPAGTRTNLRGYIYDRESGEFSKHHLKQFLRGLASCPDIEKVNVIAHSRGTDVALTTLLELHLEIRGGGGNARDELKIGRLVLAAPDLDLDVLRQRFMTEFLDVVPERFTIYSSPNDVAIGVSSWLFGSKRRVGGMSAMDLTDAEAEDIAQSEYFELINADVTTDVLGHEYFYNSPAVSSDLILLMRYGKLAGAEHGRPLRRPDGAVWHLDDGYPAR